MKKLNLLLLLIILSSCLPFELERKTRLLSVTGNTEFGEVTVYDGKTWSFLIKNLSDSTINIKVDSTKNSLSENTFAFEENAFAGTYHGSCTETIAPKSECSVSIIFSPIEVISYNSDVDFYFNIKGEELIYSLSLTGRGIVHPGLEVDIASSGDFGNIVIGETSIKSFKIVNIGRINRTITSITPPSNSFASYIAGTTCTPNTQLVPTTSCIYKVSFLPLVAQNYSSSFLVNYDEQGVLTKTISGIGVAAGSSSYVVGDTGPGGGKIFITPSTTGNSTGKYFEVALADSVCAQPPLPQPSSDWGCFTTKTNAKAYGIGAGIENDVLISNFYETCQDTCTASILCRSYTSLGTSDWYLPSIDELHEIYIQKSDIGLLASFNTTSGSKYWSSSENNNTNNATDAQTWGFDTSAHPYTTDKKEKHNVRCVRSFY